MTTPSGVALARSVTSLLEPITRAVEQLARLFGAGLKIGYPVSLFLGFWILRGYCASARIPVPVPDASILGYLAVLAAACCVIMLRLIGGPLGVFIAIASTPEFRALRPPGSTWPPSREGTLRFAKRWSLMFLPFLVSFPLACLTCVLGIWLFPWLGPNPVIFRGYSFLGMLTVVVVLLVLVGTALAIYLYKRNSERFLLGYGKARTDVAAFAGACIVGVITAWGWTYSATVAVLVLIYGTPLFQADASILNLLWVDGLLLVWLIITFFLLAWERYQAAFVLGLAVVALGMVLCAARLGGITLRLLGYGGGLPISLVARVTEPDSTTTRPELINGCLLLLTGAQATILHPVNKRVLRSTVD